MALEGIEEASPVVVVVVVVGLPDFSSVLDARVSEAGNVFELASPPGVEASFTAVVEMPLATAAAVAIFIRLELLYVFPFGRRAKNDIDVIQHVTNV